MTHVPSDERHLRADDGREPAADRAEDQHRDRRRDQEQPRLGDRGAEAVAGRGRRLHVLRDQDEGAVHPEPEQERREVRRPDAGQPHHVHVDERVASSGAPRQTQTTAITAASTSRPIVFGDPQPQVGASLTATSSATSQPESSTAPSQWTLPGARIVDSGMRTIVATVEIAGHDRAGSRRASGS